MKCKDRLHEIVKKELEGCSGEREDSLDWEGTMKRSFENMDKEVHQWTENSAVSDCRCELQTPQCDAVGSTAVVAVVTPRKVVVSNCGDSRAVLCRNGVAVPLSTDHKVGFLLFHLHVSTFLSVKRLLPYYLISNLSLINTA